MNAHNFAVAHTFSRYWPLWLTSPVDRFTWSPDVDVFERGNTMFIRMDLPGMRSDEVHVEISEDEVIISGERRPERRCANDVWTWTERAYGGFLRTIPLPVGASAGDARATFSAGVLQIEVPLFAPEIRTVSEDGRRLTLSVLEQSAAS